MFTACSYYLAEVYDPPQLKRLVADAVEALTEFRKRTHFDAIAFRGSSGSALAFAVSALTLIPVVYVRKENEQTHGRPIEGPKDALITSYVFIDDLIASGTTFEAVVSRMGDAKCVGYYLYGDCNDAPSYCLNSGQVVPRIFPQGVSDVTP